MYELLCLRDVIILVSFSLFECFQRVRRTLPAAPDRADASTRLTRAVTGDVAVTDAFGPWARTAAHERLAQSSFCS